MLATRTSIRADSLSDAARASGHACQCEKLVDCVGILRAERMDGAGEVKNVLREEMADERRRLKEEHAAQQEARRLKREAEQQRRAEAAANGQVRPTAETAPLHGHT